MDDHDDLLAALRRELNDLDHCDEPTREATAVAVLASLSPEARARVTGDDPEPGAPIASATCPCCGAHLEVTHGDDFGEVSVVGERAPCPRDEYGNEECRWRHQAEKAKFAIRAAGYDPDEVGAAEVIEKLCAERQRADDNRDAAERVGFARAEGEVLRIMRECGFTPIPGRVFTSLGEALRAAHEGGNPEHDPPEPDPDDSAEAIIRACTSADCFVTRITALVERTRAENQRLREALADALVLAEEGIGNSGEGKVGARLRELRAVLEETKG